MEIKKFTLYLISIFICFTYFCNNDKDITGPTGAITFELSPVEYGAIRNATPLGNINPPGHTFPTNHIYFYLNGSSLVVVNAIADGKIQSIHHNSWSDDYRIEFKHTETFYSYLDHVKNLFPDIKVGAQIMIGDLIGYGDPNVSAVDLGVVDYDTTRSFIIPARYHEFSLHCGDPYRYFSAEVREKLLEKNRRIIEPRGGKIDFDRDSTLAGNWFLNGTPVNQVASGYDYQNNHLAFVYDMYDPSQIRIAAGGTLNLSPFVYSVKGNSPDPSNVTLSSGIIKYELTSYPTAVLIIQLLDAQTIKIEVFPNKTKNEVSNFTTAAKIYVR